MAIHLEIGAYYDNNAHSTLQITVLQPDLTLAGISCMRKSLTPANAKEPAGPSYICQLCQQLQVVRQIDSHCINDGGCVT